MTNAYTLAITPFTVRCHGVAVDVYDTYAEAWEAASHLRGAVITYSIPKKCSKI